MKGVTSNPSIFEKAIGESDEYADALKQFQDGADHSISAIYEHLAIADIQSAAALAKDPQLKEFSGLVQDSGEGRWTVEAAIEEAVPANMITAALYARFRSRQEHTFGEKNEREKDIRYSSRTRFTTNTLRERHDVRHAINELHRLLPPEIARTEQAKRLYEHGCVTTMDIVQLIYRPNEPQGSLKDFEFSRHTMEARWKQGLSDARSTLLASPWLAPMPSDLGVRVFDVIHEFLTRDRSSALAERSRRSVRRPPTK